MSGWGCPHEVRGECERIPGHSCDPGMKGCVLFGRFTFSNESKNRKEFVSGVPPETSPITIKISKRAGRRLFPQVSTRLFLGRK
jgi:hypothetical protein